MTENIQTPKTDAGVYARFGISQWDAKYLHQALFLSKWSKDPSDRVGCVIADVNNTPIGQGYNGFPKGVSDDEKLLGEKNTKRLRTIHAEMNACIFSTKSLEGSTFYVTNRPCAACAAVMIQYRIGEVICIEDKSDKLSDFWTESLIQAELMFSEARIPYLVLDKFEFLQHFEENGFPPWM